MKILSLAASLCFLTFFSNGQELGLRFGNVTGVNNVAIDGILSLGQFSRVHADVSFGGAGVGVDAIYDPIYREFGDLEGLNYYLGVGGSLFLGDPFLLGASAEAGLEYQFLAPFSVSLDWRPTIWIITNTSFEFGGFGLNVRYRFE